jgi:hypothetical protein
LNNTKNCKIDNVIINTTGQESYGILVVNSTALLLNSSISTSNQSLDINITRSGHLDIINTHFNDSKVNVVYDSGGVLWIKNYLNILVYYNDGITPIQNADINITNNNIPIYLTSGYNGNMPQTNANGMIENVLICDRWFNYNNTPIENITNITVKKRLDSFWEDSRNYIDMNISHTETFISTDITAPPTLTGLKITRLPGGNSLNISWDLNQDTVKYEVWSIKACFWVMIDNVSHPQNWTLDENLLDNTDHYYRVRAWDGVGLKSDYVFNQFNLSDIMPPIRPQNFSVNPVPLGDALNISWNISLDDTVKYEVWWEEPDTKIWTVLKNVTQPYHHFIWSSDLLINGSSYRFKIRSWDKVGYNSSFTPIKSVIHRDYLAPNPPTNVKAIAISDTMVNLTWSPTSDNDVEGYFVYVNKPGTTSGGPYKRIGKTNNLSYSVSDLGENIRYYFIVSSFDEANNPSPYSLEVTSKTVGIKPEIPIIDEIPKYVNQTVFSVTGTSEVGAKIFVVVNDIDTYSGITNETGQFSVEIMLKDGKNWIKARARDIAFIYSNYTERINITVDLEPPIAHAGSDSQIQEGEFALFNGSASSDNIGISKFQWRFQYNEQYKILTGEMNTFLFNFPGNHLVTLTVTDLAGNQAKDIAWINVSKIVLPKPRIETTNPIDNSSGFPVSDRVMITFSLTMDIKNVEKELEITPKLDFEVDWSNSNKVLWLDFNGKLQYNTTYTITIGKVKAVNGEILLDYPYTFNFTTEEEPITSIITVTYPQPGTKFEPGESITIFGSTSNINVGTEVEISISNKVFIGEIGIDGNWSIEIKLPVKEGDYELMIRAGESDTTVLINIKSTEDGKDDETKNKGILGLGLMVDIFIFLIILIIIIVSILFLLKKRREEEDFTREEFEKEIEDEEEE